MKMISKILLILIIAIGASFNASAQKKRADKTSSAKAYYGQAPAKPNYKQKRVKKVKAARSQSSKRVSAHVRNRRKYS